MTSNNTRLRLILLSTLTLLLLVSLCFAFYKLRAENLDTTRLINLTDELERKESVARVVRELQKNASADIAAFEALTLSSETLVPTIESIESAGRALGLSTEITSLKREGEESAAARVVKMVVESSGSWSGNFSFLKALENLPQRVKIEGVYLSKSDSVWRSSIELTLSSLD